ncbi:MAG: hypothetical protein SFV15_17530 [Polyangiaceae bacterium]|nr:hypothetical protein [Polyangiaceae bacterium]
MKYSLVYRHVVGTLIAGALVLALGCSSQQEPAAATLQSRLGQSLPKTGFVPLPLKATPVALGGDPNVASPPQTAWEGSLADLIAADALVQCTLKNNARNYIYVEFKDGPDVYIKRLITLMSRASCFTWNAEGKLDRESWSESRRNPACNLDTRTGLNAFVRDPAKRAFTTAFSDFPDNSNVVDEFAYVDLNLCLAMQLRQGLNSAEILFASEDEQAQLLGIIRERAQIAALGYAKLARILMMPQPPAYRPTKRYYFSDIQTWGADPANGDSLKYLGEDFATSVRLLINSTTEYARFLQRRAATGWSSEAGVPRAQALWGEGSARVRLMNLLYGGGDPLGPLKAAPPDPKSAPAARALGGTAKVRNAPPAFVSESFRSPQVKVLLRLAREADAVFLKPNSAVSPTGIDVEASARRLFRAVETKLMRESCVNAANRQPCTDDELKARMPDPAAYPNNFGDYALWRRYQITPQQATSLISALNQGFGELVGIKTDQAWPGNWAALYPALYEGIGHLTGKHGRLSVRVDPSDPTSPQEEWLHLDPDFSVTPFSSNELATSYTTPLLPLYLWDDNAEQVHPIDAGYFQWHGSQKPEAEEYISQLWEQQRTAGVVSVLAYAQAAILHGLSNGRAAPFFSAAKSTAGDIGAAIGQRTLTLAPNRQKKYVFWPECAPINFSDLECPRVLPGGGPSASTSRTVVEIYQPSDQPAPRVSYGPQQRLLQTVALSPETTTFYGTDRGKLTALSQAPCIPSETVEGRTRYLCTVDEPAPGGSALFLVRGEGTSASYEAIFRTGVPGSYHMASGGALGSIAEQTMALSAVDWSKPKFDAFGLPTDWLPPAEASLVGGNPGEESYAYYLRTAKDAASQATSAVQTAIDSLTEQAVQTASLTAADEKARGIADLTKKALCGESRNCEIPDGPEIVSGAGLYTPVDCTKIEVPGMLERTTYKGGAITRLTDIAGVVCVERNEAILAAIPSKWILSKPVYDAIDATSATFDEYKGSEVQLELVRQWNAVQSLKRSVQALKDTVPGRATKVAMAYKDVDLAKKVRDDTQQELQQLIDTRSMAGYVPPQLLELRLQRLGELQPLLDAQAQLATLCATGGPPVDFLGGDLKGCEPGKVAGCVTQKLHANLKNQRVQDALTECGSVDCTAAQDAQRACDNAIHAAWGLTGSDFPGLQELSLSDGDGGLAAEIQKRRDEITTQEKTILLQEGNTGTKLVTDKANAEASYDALMLDRLNSDSGANGELAAHIGEINGFVSQIYSSRARLKALKSEADEAENRAQLEAQLNESQVEKRFAVARAYSSYDIWRARALLQSGRIMGLAARRAIESRFVVDLSNITKDQPFVVAPFSWADEIYASDLDVPSAVGLTAGPAQVKGAIYPNKLVDYVGNLERFVQGYAIAYPTAIASPDAQIISLPGPDQHEDISIQTASGLVTRRVLSSASKGWSFYCPGLRSWVLHPEAGLSLNTDAPPGALLSTACAGSPPTRARYRFSLNPWGFHTSLRDRTFANRYNVRWRRFAANLVGTGINDCTRSDDALACYSNTFLRYSLVHTGPSWITDFSEEWRGLDLPSGVIEGAKALVLEKWLDPVQHSWNVGAVESVGRTELLGRPTDGQYDFILELPKEMRPEQLEQVQLLAEYDYWVANGRNIIQGASAPVAP